VDNVAVELVISADGGRLDAEAQPLLPRVELLAESATTFFTRDEGIAFRFERTGDSVTAVVVMGRRAVKQR
jgi:hypothetical protein